MRCKAFGDGKRVGGTGRLGRFKGISSFEISLNFNPIVKVRLQTVFKGEGLTIGGFRWNGDLEQSLVDEFVIVDVIFFAGVVYVHLKSQERQLELFGDEAKCLRGVLLLKLGRILPATLCESILNMLCLYEINQPKSMEWKDVESKAKGS